MHFPPPLNAPLSDVTLTTPVGVVAPAPAVSVTVATHVVVPFTGTDAGAQLTLVLVTRAFAVTPALPLLVACTLSPPYGAAIVCDPTIVPVYVTVHRPFASSVQVPLPLNVPLSAVTVIVPVGVVAPAPAVSATVTVHAVVLFTLKVAGAQLTLVVVDRVDAVMVALPLLAA